MKRDLRVLAVAGALLLAGSRRHSAQKQGGILRVSHFDSPASMSLLEELTVAINRPMMGVFNNLVMYDQERAAEQPAVDCPGPRHQLVVERGRDGVDLPAAPGCQMA